MSDVGEDDEWNDWEEDVQDKVPVKCLFSEHTTDTVAAMVCKFFILSIAFNRNCLFIYLLKVEFSSLCWGEYDQIEYALVFYSQA